MKTRIIQICSSPDHAWFLIVCLFSTGLVATSAGTLSVPWFTVGGGGTSTSTDGRFSVSGTIGQPETGAAMSGGNYSLTGGFWSLYAVQSPGAPSLSIFLTSSNTVAVKWAGPATGYVLQQNTNRVSSANWSNVTATIQDDGINKLLVVSPPTGHRFYRLFKP